MRRLLALFLLGISALRLPAQDYVFSGIENQPIITVSAEIMKDIYRRLGYEIGVQYAAPARAAMESTTGVTDGEIGRNANFNEASPRLLRVPTPYYSGDTVAFAKSNRQVAFTGQESLKTLRVARIRGVLNSTEITKNAGDISEFADLETMFQFLELGRADIAVTNRIGGLLVLAKTGYTDIVPLEPALDTKGFYHFINERHRELVPRVDALIKEMIASGELEQLTRAIEKKVMEGELPF